MGNAPTIATDVDVAFAAFAWAKETRWVLSHNQSLIWKQIMLWSQSWQNNMKLVLNCAVSTLACFLSPHRLTPPTIVFIFLGQVVPIKSISLSQFPCTRVRVRRQYTNINVFIHSLLGLGCLHLRPPGNPKLHNFWTTLLWCYSVMISCATRHFFLGGEHCFNDVQFYIME